MSCRYRFLLFRWTQKEIGNVANARVTFLGIINKKKMLENDRPGRPSDSQLFSNEWLCVDIPPFFLWCSSSRERERKDGNLNCVCVCVRATPMAALFRSQWTRRIDCRNSSPAITMASIELVFFYSSVFVCSVSVTASIPVNSTVEWLSPVLLLVDE